MKAHPGKTWDMVCDLCSDSVVAREQQERLFQIMDGSVPMPHDLREVFSQVCGGERCELSFWLLTETEVITMFDGLTPQQLQLTETSVKDEALIPYVVCMFVNCCDLHPRV